MDKRVITPSAFSWQKSRRNFLKTAALAGGGMALFVCIAAPLRGSPQSGAAVQSRHYDPQDKDLKTTAHSGVPVKGDLVDPQVQNESSTDRENRRKRELKHQGTYKPITDPGPDPPVMTVVTISDYAEPIKSIPVERSRAVIIGTVLSGKAFVSQDRTWVYSDYQVRVDQVLKQDPTVNLSVGGVVVAWRPGGTIQFPSGHVEHFINHREGFPIIGIIGSQYLLFLSKLDPDIREYAIALSGAYELKNGRAYALDDYNDEYDDVSASLLLEKVRQAIGGRP